jgi:hypothetical protein
VAATKTPLEGLYDRVELDGRAELVGQRRASGDLQTE